MSKLLNYLIDKLIAFAKRTPYFHLKGYMERYWLIPYPKSKRWKFLPAARIHHILRSDDDRAFHDHPWPYMTIILRGGYTEIKPLYDKSGLYLGESRRWYGPGTVLFRRASSWHRLQIPKGKTAWTLFITGGYLRKWGFMPNPSYKVRYDQFLKEHTPGWQNDN